MQLVYIASGWFNEAQENDLRNIKRVLYELNIPYYSPKDMLQCKVDDSEENKQKVFNQNIREIYRAKFVIVNTRDKDLGTIFEAGVAFAYGIRILYYCEGLKNNFNLMLAQSGNAVATNLEKLKYYAFKMNEDFDFKEKYTGTIQ